MKAMVDSLSKELKHKEIIRQDQDHIHLIQSFNVMINVERLE